MTAVERARARRAVRILTDGTCDPAAALRRELTGGQPTVELARRLATARP